MAKSDPNLLTQAEYARSRKDRGLPGGSREAVRKAVEGQRISAFGPAKLIDPQLADGQWERNTRARAAADHPAGAAQEVAATPNPSAQSPAGSYSDARARREHAEATTAEIQLAKLRGELCGTHEVARAGFEVGRELRDALASSVNPLAAELAGLATADECAAVLRRHNRAIQEILAKALREKMSLRLEAV